MTTIKYIDPITKEEVIKSLDLDSLSLDHYLRDLHKNYLCKNYCNGQNCRIWIKISDDFVLAGIEDQ